MNRDYKRTLNTGDNIQKTISNIKNEGLMINVCRRTVHGMQCSNKITDKTCGSISNLQDEKITGSTERMMGGTKKKGEREREKKEQRKMKRGRSIDNAYRVN